MPGFRLNEDAWDATQIPISLAFIFRSSAAPDPVAIYPSPAGPTEAVIDAAPWRRLITDNPDLESMRPDVEALLINRLRGASDTFIVPIDQCYALVGVIRTNWRGLTGGPEAADTIDAFFQTLRTRRRGAAQRIRE